MSAHHIINHACIDIAYGSGVSDSAHRSELESFVTGSLLSVMEEVFDEQLQPDEVLRIEQLELDLGKVRFSDYREQMPNRLREQLRQALQGMKRRPRREADLLSASDSDSGLLYHFLRHGSLPWYRTKCDASELERILFDQLSLEPAALQRFLRQAGGNPNLYPRLLCQFGKTVRQRLLQAFAPAIAGRLSHNMRVLHSHLSDLGRRGGAGSEGPLHFYDRVWAALLKAVVDGEAVGVSADVLFARLIRRTLAASGNGLQQTLREGSSRHAVAHPDDSAVMHLLRPLFGGQAEPESEPPYIPPYAPWLPPAAGGERATAERYRLHRQLEIFLLGAAVDFEVWQKLFEFHPKALAGALRHYGKRESVRRHLVAQFDDPHLLQLLSLIEPTEHGFIHAVVNEIGSSKRNEERSADAHNARNEAWEFTLAYLFVERGSRFNKHSYLTSLVIQMANRRSSDPAQVLAQIRETLHSLDIASRFTAAILQTLSDIAQQLGIGEVINPDGEEDGTAWAQEDAQAEQMPVAASDASASAQHDTDTRQLQHQWIAFLSGGALSQLPWATLYAGQRGMVTTILRRYGQRREVRRHLVETFSTQMLHQIVALLQPSEQAYICRTVAQTVRYQHRENPDWTEQAAGQTVWEFTLAYLLLEQESRFNRRSYLSGLIRRMAASRNISAAQLLGDLRHHVAGSGPHDRFQQQLLEMLDAIAEELDVDVDGRLSRRRLGDAYAHYHMLAGLMQGERAGSLRAEQARYVAIEQLQRHAPWLLVRLFAELRRERTAYERFVANADEALLRRLLESYWRSSPHPHHQAGSDFRRTVTHYADTVQDRRLFYRYLLGALLNDELIDFDRFNAGTTGQAVREHRDDADTDANANADARQDALPEAQAPQAIAPTDAMMDGEIVARQIRHLLNLIHTLGDSDMKPLAGQLDYLLAHYSQQVRRELSAAIKDRAALMRLVRRLPESLLGQLLPLVSAAAERLLHSAELITIAAYANNLGLQRHELQRIKWLAIYTYVAQTGSLFNPPAFVRAYLEEVTALVGRSALQQVVRGVAGQLKRNAIPTTQRTIYPLLDGLSAVLPEMERENARRSRAERDEEQATSLPDEMGSDFTEADFTETDALGEIAIENAGLVLATPYLPMLFERLGLIEGRAFKDSDSAERAIHLLQYLVSAEQESAEFSLVLNKLLCGVAPEQSIRRSVSLTAPQREQVDGLLTAMIQHWSALGNTSVAGLRETFLHRPGSLRLQEDAWRLKVEERAFDVLLDRIPWSYSTVKFPWMQRIIYVEWR